MNPSVLIVDDEAQVREVLRRKFEGCGFDVCEAADGNEAMRAVDTASFDVIITDLVMPECDGIETICFIRRRQPGAVVFAMSAPNNDLFLESARGLGAQRVFAKPLQLQEIADAATAVLTQPPTMPTARSVARE